MESGVRSCTSAPVLGSSQIRSRRGCDALREVFKTGRRAFLESCGDLNVLYELEQALAAQPIPAAVQRAAYYFSNWDAQLEEAKGGALTTMLPTDLKIPMVAPEDLGRVAALRLQQPPDDQEIREVEGPERYSPQDVAEAFAAALGRPVEVVVTSRDQWVQAYRKLGFSEAAAQSYTRMTAVSIDSGFEMPKSPERGQITLDAYIRALVGRKQDAVAHGH